jgi:hypothetical protein
MNPTRLTPITRAILLFTVQAVLVLSIGGKYLYERKVCPRVWVPTAQFDPSLPLRGKYIALQLALDTCSLPRNRAYYAAGYKPGTGTWQWHVRPVAQNGKLAPMLSEVEDAPESTDELTLWENRPCDRATLSKSVDYFIPDTAKSPFPLKPHQELWVEVTVPPTGPPRPIQLALSKDGTFTPLKLN